MRALPQGHMGHDVTAVEPAGRLRDLAVASTSKAVRWVSDRLPKLAKIVAESDSFDLILISAVWMHLSAGEQRAAMKTLSHLLAPAGRLVISLRHTGFNDGRPFFFCSVSELGAMAAECGVAVEGTTRSSDVDGRPIEWTTVVLAQAGRQIEPRKRNR